MKKMLFIAAVVAVAVGFMANQKKPETKTITYVVQSGDTLWNIASEYAPKGTDLNRYIFDLKEKNGLKTSEIYTGMCIEIETGVTK